MARKMKHVYPEAYVKSTDCKHFCPYNCNFVFIYILGMVCCWASWRLSRRMAARKWQLFRVRSHENTGDAIRNGGHK
ncbi:PREDICTED: uncharacterized protein LOC109208217 isoform X6 [Nicotiana attenuata]|uniref:uncharacterized protein LOC109208217 isoform X6 n=1 Tax=Nicotiana attenuata TaxID=49451 RepID=UPI000905CA19|nr:PREDICTED: uncharacterized protein LOC109208217 isoform X6 [Nicotiana attenuata]